MVSFTDTADQDRSAVEVALREAQAAEKAARAEIEAQRRRLFHILENFPAVVASYRGPDHVFDLVSHRFQRDFPTRPIKGLSVREALPELEGQQYYEILDGVYRTGEPFYGTELETWVDLTNTGKLERQYYNVCFQATRDAHGHIDGILNFAYDVTDAVLARQQVQQLNQELEARVQERTEELRHHQDLLPQIMRQVPAAIATLSGPEHRYTFFNDLYQALSGGRTRVGLPVAEVFPEVVAQGFIGLLDQVYATGEPFIGIETPAQLFDAATGQPEPRYVDFIYQPLTDAQGRPEGVLAFIVDVTEKVRARQQNEALQGELLAAARQQADQRAALYQVFEQTPAVVALLRAPDHRYEYVNPAYQELFPGRPLEGLNVAEAVPEMVTQGFTALLDQVYQTGETHFGQEVVFTSQPAPGQAPRPQYFNFTFQAYREQGHVAGVSVFAFDVTEQVEARQEREAERKRLLNLFAVAPAAIAILAGPDFVYEFINPRYQQLVPDRELQGRPFVEALPELADNPVVGIMRQVYATGQAYQEQALLIPVARTAHGVPEDRYFTFVYQPRHDDDERVNGLLVFVFEVTEQVLARQQVLDLNRELQATNGSCIPPTPNSHAPTWTWTTSSTRPVTTSRPPSPTSKACSTPCATNCPRKLRAARSPTSSA